MGKGGLKPEKAPQIYRIQEDVRGQEEPSLVMTNYNLNRQKETIHYRGRIIGGICCIALFCIIAWLVESGYTKGIDHAVQYFAYGTRNGVTDHLMVPITYMASRYFIIAVIAILLVLPATRTSFGVPLTISSALAMIPYKILKNTFARPRPNPSMWLVQEHGFSFPSGHSMNGLIFYAMAIFLIRRSDLSPYTKNVLTAVFALLIPLIGWTRLFCGVHYVSDVFGGWSAGLAWVLLVSCVFDRWGQRQIVKEKI